MNLSIIETMKDPALFGPWFHGNTWGAWLSFLAGLFGLQMGKQQAEVFRKHTAKGRLPQKPAREAWVIVGRCGGKSLVAALVAVFLACFRDYAQYLGPGEVATVMVIAADRKQARVVMRYISGFLEAIPMLQAMLVNQTQEQLELSNRVVIEVHSCNFRAVRGYTIAAAICDEVAFWRSDESANPDTEVIAALRPALGTIPGSLLMCISSPYARRGALWEAHKKHYAVDDDPVLVWQADTMSMNPSIDPGVIERAYVEDESAAAAEYGAEFRRDIETFVAREAVEAVRIPGRLELPFVAGVRYVGFADPSGGSQDSYTLGIVHEQNGKAVLDCVREQKPPFSPEQVTQEYAELLKSYHIFEVDGDRYAGEWPREQFRKHGVEYRPSEAVKSDIYRELLAPLNSAGIELLDNPRLIAQLCGLERRTARGGKDSIDHGPGAHDDLINAAAGALTKVLGQSTHVFPELDESVHNLDRYINPADEHKWIEFHKPLNKISGLVSTFATTAFVQVGVDFDGTLFALDEYYGANRLIKDHAFDIRNVRARYENEQCTLFDPGEEEKAAEKSPELQSIMSAFRREGLPVIPAQRTAIGVGIDLIKANLRIDPQRQNPFTKEKGSPGLFISRQRCPNLWREMTALRHENDGRYIGADFAVSGLRHVLMSRPPAPTRVNENARMPIRQFGPNSWMGI
jgi:hypothetical protein